MKTIFNKPLFYVFLFFFCIWFGNYYTEQVKENNLRKEEELKFVNLLNSFYVEMPSNFEYARDEAIPFASYIKSDSDEKDLVSISIISAIRDKDLLGDFDVNFLLKGLDKYDREYNREIHKTFKVDDKNPPVVNMKDDKFTVYLNETVKPSKWVDSVFDVADGTFDVCEEEDDNSCYFVDGEINTKKEGKYEVTLVARDNHNNETKSDKLIITVKKKVAAAGKSDYVDFDSRWRTVDGYQAEIDAGYIARWGGDYWHHNWGSFMSQFWQCGVGTTVKLDGRIWRCNGVQRLYTDGYSIIDNSGHNIISDGSVQLITCATNDGTWRYVMFLSPTS